MPRSSTSTYKAQENPQGHDEGPPLRSFVSREPRRYPPDDPAAYVRDRRKSHTGTLKQTINPRAVDSLHAQPTRVHRVVSISLCAPSGRVSHLSHPQGLRSSQDGLFDCTLLYPGRIPSTDQRSSQGLPPRPTGLVEYEGNSGANGHRQRPIHASGIFGRRHSVAYTHLHPTRGGGGPDFEDNMHQSRVDLGQGSFCCFHPEEKNVHPILPIGPNPRRYIPELEKRIGPLQPTNVICAQCRQESQDGGECDSDNPNPMATMPAGQRNKRRHRKRSSGRRRHSYQSAASSIWTDQHLEAIRSSKQNKSVRKQLEAFTWASGGNESNESGSHAFPEADLNPVGPSISSIDGGKLHNPSRDAKIGTIKAETKCLEPSMHEGDGVSQIKQADRPVNGMKNSDPEQMEVAEEKVIHPSGVAEGDYIIGNVCSDRGFEEKTREVDTNQLEKELKCFLMNRRLGQR